MPFKSQAQHRKFRAMLDEGEISKKDFNEMMRETKKKHGKENPIKSLPEKVSSANITETFKHMFEQGLRKKASGFNTDIEKDTVKNENYRKVLYTGPKTQLVLMTLKPSQEIGEEAHDGDQFFRFEAGEGKIIIDGKATKVKDGDASVVPKGSKHNVVAGKKGLKLYALYAPPQHPKGEIDKEKNASIGLSKLAKDSFKEEKPLYKPKPSDRAGKKYMVYVKAPGGGKKLIHFGAKGYKHNYSEEAKKNFRARHNCADAQKDTAKWWACNYLWNKKQDIGDKTYEKAASGLGLSKMARKGRDTKGIGLSKVEMKPQGDEPVPKRERKREVIERTRGDALLRLEDERDL